MGLESGTYLDDLVTTNPTGTDPRSEGDNHIQLVKTTLKNSLPGVAGRVWRQVTKSSGPVAPALTENMTILKCTTALTVAPVSATLGNGWCAIVWAQGGDVTIDPNSSEDINGATTLTVPQGSAVVLFSTGTGSAEFLAVEAPIPTTTVDAIPSGTKALFVQTAAPTGWTKDTTHNDKALRVVSGTASSGGTTAFSDIAASAGGGHSLTTAELAEHLHAVSITSGAGSSHSHSGATLSYGTHTGAGSTYVVASSADALNNGSGNYTRTGPVGANGAEAAHTHAVSGNTANAGSGDAHSHTVGLDMQYVDVIIATKD